MLVSTRKGVNAARGDDYTMTEHIVLLSFYGRKESGIFSTYHFLHPTKHTTTTVYFYYCRQTTKRVYKNIIINKQYIQ